MSDSRAFTTLLTLAMLIICGPAAAECVPVPTGGETHRSGESIQNSQAHNTGVYAWAGGGTWVLIDSFHDPYANSRWPNADDWWVPATGGGGGPGDPGDPGNPPVVQSPCMPVLPPTSISGTPFGGGLGLHMVRTSVDVGYGPGGGGGGLHRNPMQRRGSRSGDENIQCGNSTDFDRMLNVREVIAATTNPHTRDGIWTINFGEGTSQDWMVTNPYSTTMGLVPASACRGP